MEPSSIDRQAECGTAVLLGPAVSPRRRAGGASPGALAEPLAPFVRPRRAPATGAEVGAVSPPAAPALEEASLSEALEELVAAEPEDGLGLVREGDWGLPELPEEAAPESAELLREEPEEAPGEAPGAGFEEILAPGPGEIAAPESGEILAAEPDEIFAAETGEPEGTVEAVGAREAPEAVLAEPAAGAEAAPEATGTTAPPPELVAEAPGEWTLAASTGAEAVGAPEEGVRAGVVPAEPEAASPAPRGERAPAEALSLEEGPALQEVAGRLERIASALREGRPIELFSSGSSDPLEVLIAGYALGYQEAFRRVSEERRKGQ